MPKIILVILCCIFLPIHAQEDVITVSGTVYEKKINEPMVGVMINIKGTNQSEMCDIDGRYSIRAKKSDILVFTFIGCKRQEIPVNGRTHIDVYIEEESYDLGIPPTIPIRSMMYFSVQSSVGNQQKGWMGEVLTRMPYQSDWTRGVTVYDKIKSYTQIGFRAERLNAMQDNFKTNIYLNFNVLGWLWNNHPKWNKSATVSLRPSVGYYIDAGNDHQIKGQNLSYGANLNIHPLFIRKLPSFSGGFQGYKKQKEYKHYNMQITYSIKRVAVSVGHQWFVNQRESNGFYLRLGYSFPVHAMVYY